MRRRLSVIGFNQISSMEIDGNYPLGLEESVGKFGVSGMNEKGRK